MALLVRGGDAPAQLTYFPGLCDEGHEGQTQAAREGPGTGSWDMYCSGSNYLDPRAPPWVSLAERKPPGGRVRMEGWLQAAPGNNRLWPMSWEVPGDQGNAPPYRLQVQWGLAVPGAPTWVPCYVHLGPMLGRTFNTMDQDITKGPLLGAGTHLGSRLGASGPRARNLSSRGLKVPTYRVGLGGLILGSRDSGALEPLPRSGMAGVPHPRNSQGGRAATEVVTRLLMPRVLRVPCRRPQVKARNWKRAQVTVGK